MTFGQQVTATLIGTVSGFLLSIFLFYLKEKWIKHSAIKLLKKNVINEIEYNIKLLTQVLTDLKKCIEKITVNDRLVYCNVNYGRFARYFLQSFYQSGHISEKWNLNDIDKLDHIMIYYNVGSDSYVLHGLENWRNSSLDQRETLNILGFERDNLEKHINDLTTLKNKLKTK